MTDSKNEDFLKAVEEGWVKNAEFFLRSGADVHFNDESALRIASRKGNLEMVEMLVKRGASISKDGGVALKYALAQGHTNLVKYLTLKGNDELTSEEVHNSLVQAVNNRNYDLARYLLTKI